ncbi:MAG: CBS domain-containing protein [Clostridiales bacterium]|nr:CBS domain-containing protein [Clostridiales bacterium]
MQVKENVRHVKELMSTGVVTVTPGETAVRAAHLMARHNIGALPVCDLDGKLKGILTDRDIVLRCIAADNDPENTQVSDIMTKNVITISPEEDIRKASKLMADYQIRRLPVIENEQVVGMLSLGDLARTQKFDMEASKALSEISSNIKKL